jgi:putative transposase
MAIQPQTHVLLGLADAAKQRMQAKLQILRDLELYRHAHGYTHQVAAVKFAEGVNAGEIAIDGELTQQFEKLSPKTLENWRLTLKRDGIAALAGRYGNRKGQNTIDSQPQVRDHIVGCLVKFPHARATRVLEFVQARLRDRPGIELPSERSLQRWIEGWKQQNAQTYTAITNPDRWKGRYKAAFGDSSEHIVRLNQLWELDTTPADVMLTDGRYCLAGGIDVYSRRATILVTRTARSNANAELLRKKILAEGKPEEVKTDQGKDYVSSEFTTFLAAVEIQHSVSNKFSPWEKPHIERFFRTFSHDLLELLPGYTGHNVADAQELRAQTSFAEQLFEKNAVVQLKMSAAELQEFCDTWCDARYAHRSHDGLNGKTPMQMVAQWPHPIERIEDERALDLLLLEVPTNKGVRTVQKKGIRLPEGWFISPELEEFIGHNVHCRYLDAGRIVCYSAEAWQFICIAVEPDLAGYSRKEIAAKTRDLQKQRVQDERAALRAIERSVTPQDAAAEILREDARASGKLVVLPRRAEQVSTPALRAAAEARDAIEAPRQNSSTLLTSEEFSQARSRIEQAARVSQPLFESPQHRACWLADEQYKRALSGEEQSYLDDFRARHPKQAREMDKLMQMRHGRAALKSV